MHKSFRNLLVAVMMASAAYLSAFSFQPMFVRLDTTGAGNVQTFQVSNEGDTSIAIRFSVLTRTVGLDGKEANKDASALFTMYPARVVVEPHSNAAMKLQWNGPSDLTAENSFRLVAENVALDSSVQTTSGLRVMFRYMASVYVGKPDFTPRLSWVVKGATGASGVKGFSVQVVNNGTRHVIADSALLTISGVKGKVLALGTKDLGILSGANYLPGSPQSLFIPNSDAIPGSIYNAKLEFDPKF